MMGFRGPFLVILKERELFILFAKRNSLTMKNCLLFWHSPAPFLIA